ncbi:MAG: response regulator transcription factor [Burkholderiaceae bacterium]|nr:MAG: response regulator transcription factor [Burkholderiaceae bacterium]
MQEHPMHPGRPAQAMGPRGLVMIVEDQALIRLGLRSLLQWAAPRCQVMEAGSLGAALSLYPRAAQAGLSGVLLDLTLPEGTGLWLLDRFLSHAPGARVIAMGSGQATEIRQRAIGMGAVEWLDKEGSLKDIHQTLNLALPQAAPSPQGGGQDFVAWPPTSTAGSQRSWHDLQHLGGVRPQASREAVGSMTAKLSPRQRDILDALLAGCSNAEIAARTGLASGTVKNYVSGLLLSFHVKSRSQLVAIFR